MDLDFDMSEIENVMTRFEFKCLVFGLIQQLGEFDRSNTITNATFYHLQQELEVALDRLNRIKDDYDLDY